MEIQLIETQRALSLTNIDIADFVINPYKGCQLGCLYCYSRSNKSIKKIKKEWGEYVYIKYNIPILLKQQLECIDKNIKRILIGSTTEPFQPVERKYNITSSILKILKSYNIPIVILTKSNFILDYLELIDSENNKIYFTYNSEIVRELFEKRTFPQEQRLKVIGLLNKSKVRLIVYISPVFPFLTDIKTIFENLNGLTKKIYIEGYNAKMGNWEDIKTKLSKDLVLKYEKIFFNEFEYNSYWDEFISFTNDLNSKFNFDIQYFIYPFDSYYNL